MKTGLQHLDAAHVANCRIGSISALLMAHEHQPVLDAEDIRVLGDLIHTQTRTIRDCLAHFTDTREKHSNKNERCIEEGGVKDL